MEYHYFTIEDVEMLKFNGITHLHNHLNYLIHTDKDQKFTEVKKIGSDFLFFLKEGAINGTNWIV